MDYLLIDAKFTGKIVLPGSVLEKCKKYGSLGLFAAVQFTNQISIIKEQLEKIKIKIITSKPDRTNVTSQVLGCDVKQRNFNLEATPEAFLYIGDGDFHPQAIALAYPKLKVLGYDPYDQKLRIVVAPNVKKQRGALVKFLSVDTIGILVTTKPGQQQFKAAKLLEKKYPEKTFYYFLDNTIDYAKCEDFPFIKSWVNTACPRLLYDDSPVSVVNLADVTHLDETLRQ